MKQNTPKKTHAYLGKRLASLVLVLALTLTGCGANTDNDTVTRFTSEDQSVSVEVTGQWKQENCTDLFADGDETLSWFTAGWIALSNADNDMLVVAQIPESLPLFNDQDELLSSMFVENTLSTSKSMDNPAVPNMDVLKTTHFEATDISGNKGEIMVLYGETTYAQYMILYSAKKIKTADVEFFNNFCASFKEAPPETENDASVNSTDTVQWFNNTYAILTVLNDLDYTLYGGAPANSGGKIFAETVLENSWDVTDRASADETLLWLTEEGGHRISFAEEMGYLEEIGLTDVPEEERAAAILASYDLDEAQAQSYTEWYALYEQYGADAAAGWDYSRAMWLLSYYYLAGYYTEEEALDQSLELAKTIQETFDSWDSFMESYFAGYEYWAEESSADRREIYESLKSSSDNPFALDWNTTLEKSW